MSGWKEGLGVTDARLLPDNIVRLMSPEDRKSIGRHCLTAQERQARIESKSEKELQDQIAALLGHNGIFYGRQRMDRKSNIVIGYPDFWFALQGRPIALEVKVGSNRQTPEQLAAQIKMEANGWAYFVVRSLAEVKAILGNS